MVATKGDDDTDPLTLIGNGVGGQREMGASCLMDIGSMGQAVLDDLVYAMNDLHKCPQPKYEH